ncbi:hypothetical protein DRO49_05370, partial [Candidatus Bathyarchaeota archaeon]
GSIEIFSLTNLYSSVGSLNIEPQHMKDELNPLYLNFSFHSNTLQRTSFKLKYPFMAFVDGNLDSLYIRSERKLYLND